jgi:hypothetical protein
MTKEVLYGRGDPQSDERAREHAPAGVISPGAGAVGALVHAYTLVTGVTACW